MQIALTGRLPALAPGLTARSAPDKFAAIQIIYVHLPTTDGREILLTRCGAIWGRACGRLCSTELHHKRGHDPKPAAVVKTF